MKLPRPLFYFFLLLLRSAVAPSPPPPMIIPQRSVLLLSEGRSGSAFIGAILNKHERVSYFSEPCASSPTASGPGAGRQCEELVMRLLACNATEADLFGLLRHWPSARHDTALLALAARAGALRYDGRRAPQRPGVSLIHSFIHSFIHSTTRCKVTP